MWLHELLFLFCIYLCDGGELKFNSIQILDDFPELTTERNYQVFVPDSYCPQKGADVWFYMHGHGQLWEDWVNITNETLYAEYAETYGFLVVFPIGRNASTPEGRITNDTDNCGNSWNCGTNGAEDTCEGSPDDSCCYSSCAVKNECNGCGWSSCYDDLGFITDIIQEIKDNYNTHKFYITGQSNGGMFTYYVVRELPTIFDGYFPVFGLPQLGYMKIPTSLRHTPLLHLHDRFDETIPWEGGEANGWFYHSIFDVLDKWLEVHHCVNETKILDAPFSGLNLECATFENCESIAWCLYDGQHGDTPIYLEQLQTWWLYEHLHTREVTVTIENSLKMK